MKGTPEFDTWDCLILKGLAILTISFHNYFHLLSRVRENEFDFSRQRFLTYLTAIQDPSRIVQATLSFLGHYGVQIFVFLSAYGLAVRYWDHQPTWIEFIRGRVQKLYPMFLLSIALWALWVGFPRGPLGPLEVLWLQRNTLLLTVFGVLNIVPYHHQLPVGPWWFMPFIMQVYFLWPLLTRFARRFGPYGLCGLSIGALALTYAFNDMLAARWSISILQTPVGHLPECCLGIAVARFGYRPGKIAASVSAVVFLLSNLVAQVWILSFISGLVLIIWAYRQIRPILRPHGFLARVGNYSPALFFVNGFVRLPFVLIAARFGLWYVRLLLGVESVSLGLALALLMTVGMTWLSGRFRGADSSASLAGAAP